jgi:hypothetical protein
MILMGEPNVEGQLVLLPVVGVVAGGVSGCSWKGTARLRDLLWNGILTIYVMRSTAPGWRLCVPRYCCQVGGCGVWKLS